MRKYGNNHGIIHVHKNKLVSCSNSSTIFVMCIYRVHPEEDIQQRLKTKLEWLCSEERWITRLDAW